MRSLRISVVIPTYQRPQLLLRCLTALLQQNFCREEFEIIVVSDGIDPATSHSLASLPSEKYPTLRYYPLPEKSGPAAARNLGWILAEAPLVVFTDDDCIPDRKWLEAMWTCYQSAGRREVAFSGRTVVPLSEHPTDYEKNISHLASAEFITANCACTRKALARVGGFDERFKMAWREDSDLQFKFIDAGIPILKAAEAVVTHPVRKAPWGVSLREERKGMFNALLYKKFPRLYKERIQPTPQWHYYVIAAFLIAGAAGFIAGQDELKFAGLAGWILLTSGFTWKRLKATSHSWKHVAEMFLTSAVIPLLSLFWRFYGSWKYRVLLVR
ncbi:MAG TPA: glycosyltransferase [Chryseosolibacter sp.]